MAAFEYDKLQEDYGNFEQPIAMVTVNGKDISEDKKGVTVANVSVELTSGFEASQAEYELYNVYDATETEFLFDRAKSYILLGSVVVIYYGYDMTLREVFRGVICQVDFVYEKQEIPHIRVSAMDVKAVMMANHYHKQLTATSYSAAVQEIFNQGIYESIKGADSVIKSLSITPTPDDNGQDQQAGVQGANQDNANSDVSIEMVGESDYEFVVRAAKKFNYEFFCTGGQVIFRKAKSDPTSLIVLSKSTVMERMNVGYDITGLVGKVEVRGLNVGQGKVVTHASKNANKISQGGKAKPLIANSEYVFVDPTVLAKSDAESRASYLLDEISYRFGSLELDMIGLPEIVPGRFIELNDFGTAISNTFYVTSVRHHLYGDGRYITHIEGKAASMRDS